MKENINNLNFVIMRNNELDADYLHDLHIARLKAFGSEVLSFTESAGKTVLRGAVNVIVPIWLSAQDAANGTQYLDEYLQAKQESRPHSQ